MLARRIVIVIKSKGVQEGFEKSQLITRRGIIERARIRNRIEIRIVTINRLGQHGMTKAIHDLRKLSRDRGVNVRVMRNEGVLQTRQRRNEFIEDGSVILHLCTETSSLKDPLAVPIEAKAVYRNASRFLMGQGGIFDRKWQSRPGVELPLSRRCIQPFIQIAQIPLVENLALRHRTQAIMLRVKNRMDRGERDILVTAAIATDKMCAEKLVVIGFLT